MKHLLKISTLVVIALVIFPNFAHATSCSGTAITSSGVSVPYSYTIVGKNISNGQYQFGNQTYNGVTSNVSMSFSNPNFSRAVPNTCFSQSFMNSGANSAVYFIPQFLGSGRTSWTQTLISCGNTHVYSKSSPAPVNGVCATAKNTCSSGSFSNAGSNSSSFTWTCNGSNGGSNAQCSLNNGDGGGRNGGSTTTTTTNIFPADFNPYCVPNSTVATADGEDLIVWSVKDTAGRPFGNYNFNWAFSAISGVDFDADNSAAASMSSINPVTIPADAISVRVSGGSLDTTIMCSPAKFVNGITTRFSKPIVEPNESCQLNWSGIDVEAVPVCKIYNEQNVIVDTISGEESGSRPVPPNDKYYIKCESVPNPLDLGAETSFIQSEFLQCIRRGDLIEI